MDTTTVPAGHAVRVVGRTLEPSLERLPGGLLVATTGCGGDDQASEVAAMLDGLAAQVQPCAVVFSAQVARLEELFAPGRLAVHTVESAAVVFFQKGSLAGWTDASLARVVAQLRDLGLRTQLVVGLEPAPDVLRLVPLLEAARVSVRLAGDDGAIAAEVRRPDGTVVTGLAGQPPPRVVPATGAAEGTEVLVRSPRFDALVLGVVREPQARSLLEAYLATRRAPLGLIAVGAPTGAFAIQPRSWPGKEALVAYGNEPSLHRAARELGHPAGSYAIAAVPPSRLFPWAVSLDMPVMLCAFDGPKAWHVPLDVPDLRRLAPS